MLWVGTASFEAVSCSIPGHDIPGVSMRVMSGPSGMEHLNLGDGGLVADFRNATLEERVK